MELWLILALGLGTFWDGITSLLGIVGIFGVTKFDLGAITVYITAVIGSFIILGLSLNSEKVWEKPKTKRSSSSEDYWKWLRPVHILCVVFDAYTSFLGTAQYIILRDYSNASISIDIPDVMQKTTFGQQIVILFITILVVISPMIFPKIRQ